MVNFLKRNIFFLLIITILFLSFFQLSSAQESTTDKVLKILENWKLGNLDEGVAKVAFTGLVFLLIFPLIKLLPVWGQGRSGWNKIFRFILAVCITFLSTAYLTPQDVKLTLVSYSAMGMVLGGIVPLLLLIYFTIDARKSAESSSLLMSWILWLSFIAFLIYKLLSAKDGELDSTGIIVYLGIIILSILFLFFQGFVMKILASQGFAAERDAIESEVKKEELVNQINQERYKALLERARKQNST